MKESKFTSQSESKSGEQMGEKLGEAGEESEAAGHTRNGAETEEPRVSSGGEVSTAGGSLYTDLSETVCNAFLFFLHLLVVEERQDDEESSTCEKESEETGGSKEQTGESRGSTKE